MGEEAGEGVVSLIPGEASAEAGHALTGMLKGGSCNRWGGGQNRQVILLRKGGGRFQIRGWRGQKIVPCPSSKSQTQCS